MVEIVAAARRCASSRESRAAFDLRLKAAGDLDRGAGHDPQQGQPVFLDTCAVDDVDGAQQNPEAEQRGNCRKLETKGRLSG